MKIIKEYKDEIIQFIKFNIVGVVNTLVDFSVFTLLNFLGVYCMIAQVISYSCGVINSFIMNKNWTFEAKGRLKGSDVIKFVLTNIVSLAVSLFVLYVLKDYFGVMYGKIIATVVSMTVNFMGNKFWVFRYVHKEDS
ncbi:GtrA family protein [Aceticella autotrophica]|uniref:GtrA family protein n=1 Tax=Aceticella autotrophica TaxID=2755338 RepID=A0A975AV75_9THEO|nr:GtrA family protein [Aceticella autotrophica]QSZ27048.1 GtrA family protein [Aceticella autotrophica]